MAANPWAAQYSDRLREAFRNASWLHLELVPYIHSYDFRAYETGEPILRHTSLKNESFTLGEELFVSFVTQKGLTMTDVHLPEGTWVDFWDETRTFVGPTDIRYPVPLGHEPVFVRAGAIIPMNVSRSYTGHGTPESKGSLTVLVYPSGDSSFELHDEQAQLWRLFRAHLVGDTLTLEGPSLPSILYRVARQTQRPRRVSRCGARISVNDASTGVEMPELSSEAAVNGSVGSGWYYDPSHQRLIVKQVVP